MNRSLFVAVVCLASISPLYAQMEDAPAADGRIAEQLDQIGVKYEIDDEGDFRVVFQFDEDKRSQVVYVNSETVDFNDMEIREIWSPASRLSGELSSAVANRLLIASFDAPLGGWQVAKGEDGSHTIVFCVKLGADADSTTLDRVLTTVVAAADDMEKELTGKDEL
jgi:hypothetical protein